MPCLQFNSSQVVLQCLIFCLLLCLIYLHVNIIRQLIYILLKIIFELVQNSHHAVIRFTHISLSTDLNFCMQLSQFVVGVFLVVTDKLINAHIRLLIKCILTCTSLRSESITLCVNRFNLEFISVCL